MHPWKLYGIRLSHIFEIPSTSNEKPGISIKMYFDQKPWISIEILGFSHLEFDILGISSEIACVLKRCEIPSFY